MMAPFAVSPTTRQVNPAGALLILLAVFIVPALIGVSIMMLIKKFTKWTSVTRPMQNLEQQINASKSDLAPVQAGLEGEYQRTRNELEAEIKRLQSFREKCLHRQYV
jgi:predicted PurR-regulated permease PerM